MTCLLFCGWVTAQQRALDVRRDEIEDAGDAAGARPAAADVKQPRGRLDGELDLDRDRRCDLWIAWPEHEIGPMTQWPLLGAGADLGACQRATLLALLTAQLSLPGDAMVAIAELERDGDARALDQVRGAGGADAGRLEPTRADRPQTAASDGVERGPVDQRPVARQQTVTLGGEQPGARRADADVQSQRERLGGDGAETGGPANDLRSNLGGRGAL
jgi:hypothetical protein